jgi:hypothetical protein
VKQQHIFPQILSRKLSFLHILIQHVNPQSPKTAQTMTIQIKSQAPAWELVPEPPLRLDLLLPPPPLEPPPPRPPRVNMAARSRWSASHSTLHSPISSASYTSFVSHELSKEQCPLITPASGKFSTYTKTFQIVIAAQGNCGEH